MSTVRTQDLQSRGVRGGILIATGQVARTLVQFVGLVVLARLLEPGDFGLVAMATAVVGITAVLSDVGLSMSIIRTEELPRTTRDRIFYVNVLMAVALAGVVWFLAPLVAQFYGEPKLEAVTRWLSLFAFLGGIAPQYRAELARSLRFRSLAVVDVVSQLVGLIAAVIVAVQGAGYWSVVVQQGAATCALMILLMVMTKYVPVSRPGFRGLSAHLSFGVSALAVQATNYAAVSTAPIAVARLVGVASVGLYSRSYQLISLPMVQLASPLTRVVVPLLARVNTPDDVVRAARRIQLVLTYTLCPLLVFLFVGGQPLVVLLFGNPWRHAGELVQILAAGAVFQTLGYIHYWLFVHKGRLAELWLFEVAVSLVITPLYFLLGHRGATVIASLYSLGLLMNWLLVGCFGLRRLGLPPGEFMGPSLLRLAWLVPVMACGSAGRMAATAGNLPDLWIVGVASLSSLLPVPLLALSAQFRGDVRTFLDVARSVRGRP